MKTIRPVRAFLLIALLAVFVSTSSAALADPANRSYTTTTTVFVAHHDGFWINAYEPPGTPPHDHSGNHQAFCPSPGSLAPGEDPANCHGNWNPPWDEYATTTVTVNNPPATVSSAVSCTLGAGGWCISPATLTVTGKEPVAGYSIYQVKGTRNGSPFTCSGASCSFPIADTVGDAFTYQAFSTYGDSSYAGNRTVRVDTAPPITTPSLSGASGQGGWYTSPVVVALNAVDAISGVASTALNSLPYTGPVTISTQGVTAITFGSTDRAGNVEATGTSSFSIDSVPPVSAAALVGTTGDNGWYTSPVTITLSGSDATSGLSQLVLNGTPYSGPMTVMDGVHALSHYAVDQAGNQESVQPLTVRVDTAAPVTTPSLIGAPGANGWYTSASVTYAPAIEEATSGVALTQASVDGAAYVDAAGGLTITGEGLHTIAYRTRDVAGNQEPEGTVSLSIDSVPPNGTLTSTYASGDWVSDTVRLSGTTTDATSGVAAVELSIDGAQWIPLSDSNWSYDWNTRLWPDGEYTLIGRGLDVAGNQAETAPLVLKVDNSLPAANIALNCAAPGLAGWCKGPVEVTLSGSDAGSGLRSLTYTYRNHSEIVPGVASFVETTEGAFPIELAAVDQLGHEAQASNLIKADLAPPQVKFNSGNRSSLNVDVNDSGSGIERWTLQVLDGRGRPVFQHDDIGPFSGAVPWPGLTLPAGTYALEIFAADHAGFETRLPSTQFTLASAATATPVPTSTPTPDFIQVVLDLILPPTPTATLLAATPLPPTPLPTLAAPTAWPATPTPTLEPTTPIRTPTQFSTTGPTATPTQVAALPVAKPSGPADGAAMRPILGLVFHDANRNGQRDWGEPGLADVPIEVVGLNDGGRFTLASDREGTFGLLLPVEKRYSILLRQPGGWSVTTPASYLWAGTEMTHPLAFGLDRDFLTLILIGLLVFLLIWLASAAMDRRASAVQGLAGELNRVLQARRGLPG
jgi:hypothetical protein